MLCKACHAHLSLYSPAFPPPPPSFLSAWTEGNGLAFPLDHHLVWFVLGLAFTFGTVVAFRVPASDAYRRTEDGEEVRSGGRHTHMLEV